MHYWPKKIAWLSYPIKSQTKTTSDSLAHIFPRYVSATMPATKIYFECHLVDSMTAQSDFNLWFRFHDRFKSCKNLIQVFNLNFKNLLRVLIGWFDHCTEWYLPLASISRYPNENCFKICTTLIQVFNLNCKRFKSRKQVPSKEGTSQAWIKDRDNGGKAWELDFLSFLLLSDLYVFARLSPSRLCSKSFSFAQ